MDLLESNFDHLELSRKLYISGVQNQRRVFWGEEAREWGKRTGVEFLKTSK